MVSQRKSPPPRLLEGQRSLIVAIAVFSAFLNILLLTVPIYMLQLFERVMGTGNTSTLAMLALGASVALIAYFFFDVIRQRLLLRLGNRLEKRFNTVMLSHQIHSVHRGDIHSVRALQDLRELRGYLSGQSFIALLDSPWAIVYVAVIFMFHFYLGLIALVGALILLTIGIMGEYITRGSFEKAMEANAIADNQAASFYRTADVAHSMSAVSSLVRIWSRSTDYSMSFGTRAADMIGLLGATAKFIRMGLQLAIMSVGVLLIIANEVSPGIMIASSIIMARALAPVEQSIAGWRSLVAARRAYHRVKSHLSQIHKEADKLPLPEPDASLKVSNLRLFVPGMERPILQNVSFELQAGQAFGIIGPSGSGKTSLARILCGLEEPSFGEIRLDGSKISDWPGELLGKYIGYLPQRVELISGTVAENIALHDPDAEPADIIKAAMAADVHQMILNLPEGYNSPVGAGGDRLSAGQRQLVALARTFYGNRKLIILDEPNANLDPAGEKALAKAIVDAKARGCTIILITHRSAVLSNLDSVLVLNGGVVTAQGSPEEVLAVSRDRQIAGRDPASKLSLVKGDSQTKGQAKLAAGGAGTPPLSITGSD